MRELLVALVILVGIGAPQGVAALVCDRGTVRMGDSKYVVTEKCGEPTFEDQIRVSRVQRDAREWTERLVAYLRDPDLGAAHAEAGRRAVEERWSLAALAPGFVKAARDVTS